MRRWLHGCAWFVLFSFLCDGAAMAANAVVSTCDEGHFKTAFNTVNVAPGGTISFTCSGTIALTSSAYYVGNGVAMVIDGGGHVTIDGGGTYALVQVYGTASLALKRLTLQRLGSTSSFAAHPVENFGSLTFDAVTAKNNVADVIDNEGGDVRVVGSTFSSNTASGNGAAIVNGGGTLFVGASTFSGNTASSGNGGAIFNDGGVAQIASSTFTSNSANIGGAIANGNGGQAYVSNSTFTTNHAFDGGAIQSESPAGGGLVHVSHSIFTGNTATYGGAIEAFNDNLTVRNGSAFSSNQASAEGGAIWNVGGSNPGTVSISQSTFTGNTTPGAGGAVECDAGSLRVDTSTFAQNVSNVGGTTFTHHGGAIYSTCYLVVVNSTFYNNTATNAEGGAIYQQSPTTSQLALVTHGTFVSNHAAEGAAIGNDGAVFFQISNSILSGNTHGHSCAGGFNSTGYNLADDSDCGGALSGTGDLPNVTLTMGPLANNGGPTQTIAPASGNPAIDHLPTAQCAWTTDQRGATRPAGPACDSGAVEVGGAIDSIFKDGFELP